VRVAELARVRSGVQWRAARTCSPGRQGPGMRACRARSRKASRRLSSI
jgi:hypothetical protein